MISLSDAWQWFTMEVLSKSWFLPLITVIGGVFTFWRWRVDKKYDRRNVELLNAPNFKFFDFCCKCNDENQPPLGGLCNASSISPRHCTQCDDVHWFNIQYVGKVAIRNFSIALISEKDISSLPITIERRLLKYPHIAPGTVVQYKLPRDEIKESRSEKICFSVLIEYQSEYSNIKYKQIYHLCASNIDSNDCNEWPFNLVFFNSKEEAVNRNRWYIFPRKLSAYIRHTLDLRYSIKKNWVNDFWRKK